MKAQNNSKFKLGENLLSAFLVIALIWSVWEMYGYMDDLLTEQMGRQLFEMQKVIVSP